MADPLGTEGAPQSVAGLGLLDVVTRMAPEKNLGLETCQEVGTGLEVRGYEIHMGETTGNAKVWLRGETVKGVVSGDGRIFGTYLHGLFASDAFRDGFLAQFGVSGGREYGVMVDQVLDRLAMHLEAHADLDAMLAIAKVCA